MNLTEIVIILDQQEDLPHIQGCKDYLDHFGLRCEVHIGSAMRDPAGLTEYLSKSHERGIRIFIAAAGMAGHLAAFVASKTTMPVIGVPLPTSHLNGIDALYAMAQMQEGVPVATMAVGEAGAKNAAVLAAQILALTDNRLKERLRYFKQNGCRF